MRRPHDLQRTLNDDAVRHVFFTECLFGEKKSFQIDGAHRNAFERNSLSIRSERFIGLAVGIEQNVHDKGIGDSGIFTLFEPGWFDLFGRLIRKNQQGFFDSLSCRSRSRNYNINIGRCPVVAMGRQR